MICDSYINTCCHFHAIASSLIHLLVELRRDDQVIKALSYYDGGAGKEMVLWEIFTQHMMKTVAG